MDTVSPKVVDFEALNWQRAKSLFVEARRDKDDEAKLDQFLQGWTSVQEAKDMCISTKNQASKEYAPILGSILAKIEMASQVGDLAMKAAPESVGLAWMGVKLCLHSVMDDFATCQLFGVACSDIVGILITCACYGRMYGIPKGPESFQEIHSQIADGIPQIYCNILEVSFAVKKYMSHNKLVRTSKNFFRSANEKFKGKIQELHDNEAKMCNFAHTASEQMQEFNSSKVIAGQDRLINSQDATTLELKALREQLSSFQQMRKSDEATNAELLETFKIMSNKTPLAAAKEQCQTYQKQFRMDAIQSDILQRKRNDRNPKETCLWIFENSEYKQWRDSAKNNILWISGHGGCGKSILVSAIIDALGNEVKDEESILHYFYCDAGDESSKKTEKISRHLLSQLLEIVEATDAVGKIDEANKTAEKVLQRRSGTKQAEKGSSKESITFPQAYREIVRTLARPKVYLIMDALDECIDLEEEGLIQSLKDIAASVVPDVSLKILLCSRPEPEIQKELRSFPSIDVESNNGPDIERNVKAEIEDLSGWTEAERELACKEVTRKAGSYFRCVALLVQLLKQPWRRPLSARLSELPEGLNNNYREILQKTDPAYVELLRICMTWMTLAEDEVKVGEIMDVYTRTFTELQDVLHAPENDGQHQIDQIITAGSSFLRVIPGTKVVKLRHYTVKEFFLGDRKPVKPGLARTSTLQNIGMLPENEQHFVVSEKEGHIEIAIAILDHLSSKLFRETYMEPYLPVAKDDVDLPIVPNEVPGTQKATSANDEETQVMDNGGLPALDANMVDDTAAANGAGLEVAHTNTEEADPVELGSKQANGSAETNEASEAANEEEVGAGTRSDSDSEVDSDDLDFDQSYSKTVTTSGGKERIVRYEPQYLLYHLQKIEELWGSSPHESPLWAELEQKLDAFFQPDAESFLTWVNYLISDSTPINTPMLEVERGTITPIHVACAFGLVSLLKRFMNRGDDLFKATVENWNALHMASQFDPSGGFSQSRKSEILKILLEAGLSPNEVQGDTLTPFQSLLYGTITPEHVRLFIEHGADCDLPSLSKRRPLHAAAQVFEDAEVLKTVLDGAKDINAIDAWGLTPLHVLVEQSKVPAESLSALLKRGANVNAEDDHSKMPLAIAAAIGEPETLETLIEAGAQIDDDNLDGMTALHFAALNSRTSNVKVLLEKGADVARLDSKGKTALYHAFARGDTSTCQTLVEWYMEHDADVLKKPSKKGKTALRKAAAGGHDSAIAALLKVQNDVGLNEADTKLGYTPLHAAARRGHTAVVSKLIEHEANAAIKDKNGKTALQVACSAWNEEDTDGDYEKVLLLLIQEEPEIADKDPALLHVAASKGSLEILRRLHEQNVDLNKQDEHGWTALEFARQYDQEATIGFLEGKGTSIGIQPSGWEVTNPKFLRLSDDGLEISYNSESHKSRQTSPVSKASRDSLFVDSACALTDHPIPAGTRRWYYEVEVEALHGDKDFPIVVMGISRKRNAARLLGSLPGWPAAGPLNWGYHGEDGTFRCSASAGTTYDDTKKYNYGDTVGCGIDLDKKSIFFTRNGIRLGKLMMGPTRYLFSQLTER